MSVSEERDSWVPLGEMCVCENERDCWVTLDEMIVSVNERVTLDGGSAFCGDPEGCLRLHTHFPSPNHTSGMSVSKERRRLPNTRTLDDADVPHSCKACSPLDERVLGLCACSECPRRTSVTSTCAVYDNNNNNNTDDATCLGAAEGGGRRCHDSTLVNASSVRSEVSGRQRRLDDDVQVEDHRQELSILTVLLALLAIARSKCLLTTSPPLARANLARRTNVVTVAAAVVCVVLCVCGPVAPVAASLSPRDIHNQTSNDTELKVCTNIDVRNSVASFDQLKNCRVVEGFVQILLIDKADESNYTNISFPELREITGYLLLFRANGLRSIGSIFPNLAVIRGNVLFYNYALISYEMQHLQEIGLHSLTDVVRGSVGFDKNPMLCYASTIDWDIIAKTNEHHYIKGNRVKNECPMCPNVTATNVTCPKRPLAEDYNCWNRQYCQKVCPKECPGTCDKNGECCHKNCLGGCKEGPSKTYRDCFVCKDVEYNGTCIDKCPFGTFEYLNRRCVLDKECYNMTVPTYGQNVRQNTTWKPFNNTSCILDCPSGYEEKRNASGMLHCVTCKGLCRKECLGASVDNIASAQNLRGCTYIKGSLEIQITGGKNIVKELEENLNMIEEIEGGLKIVRSVPLISLNFLKNLRVIHGDKKHLDNQVYSLYILENQNLVELWDRNETLEIRNGRMFFHFNPKLCMYKIKQLSEEVHLNPPYNDQEVAIASNGEKIACNVTHLHVWTDNIGSIMVVLKWDKFVHYDMRSLLGYVVYTIEAPYQNLTLYDGRDACGSDGWKVDDVDPSEDAQLLTNLKPFTQYAYYVKTYMTATETSGGQSPIQYFRTLSDLPSPPQLLKVQSNSSTELVVTWKPPLTPNGNVTHYKIMVDFKSDEHSFLVDIDYCKEPTPHTGVDKLASRPIQEEDDKTTPNPNACFCEEKTDKRLQQEDIDHKEWSIHFEDMLHNQLYVKRADSPSSSPSSRKRRSIAMIGDPALEDSTTDNITDDHTSVLTVYNSTIVVVSGLQHYGHYAVNVQACLTLEEARNSTNVTEVCSMTSIESGRTQALVGADHIPMVYIDMTNASFGMVKVMWDEPPRPNGIILAYHIEYRLLDKENYKFAPECTTRRQFRQNFNSYTIENLVPGNYSVHVRASSLAGDGEYTPKAYFMILEASSSSTVEWLVGCLVGTVVVLLACFVFFFLRRKYGPKMPKGTLIADVNPEYMSTVYVPDEWEVPRKNVELLKELGQGSFGMVYEGIGHDIAEGQRQMRCAIKTVGEHATDRERSEFLNEASVMKAFHTHHVVQLLGVVSIDQPVLVVMELMTHGDLKTYLRSHRPSTEGDQSVQPPTLKRILQMAIEIADGMSYLAAKKFVHRDLAARNCMVAEDLTVKIGDFGMTRDIYETDYYRKGTKGLLPVRWMAPESLKDGVFTSRSDVWSYGVVLWEMATLASQPYQGLSNDQVLRYVIDGGVMERPENCPDRLYELMRLCWQHKPLSRPPFLDLVTILLADVPADFNQVSFYHSKEGCELRAHMAEASVAAEDDPATPLRITRDIEDFSLGGSDLDDDEEPFEVTAHSPSTSSYLPRFGSIASTQQPLLLGNNDHVIVSLSSNGHKLGNGSAVTSPTTANGWVVNHQNNGTDNASASQRTTEC